MAKKKFLYYVVRKGYNPGIYRSWEECKNQVSGFPDNEYKGFSTLCEAEAYFNKSGLGNCGIEVGADKKLLEENNYKKFSDSVFTGETTKSPLVESTPLKASEDFKTEAEDCSEYFSLESLWNSSYKLEFASASEGNIGKSGAGIVLRKPDDSVACGLMVGLGTMSNVVAEFTALIVGMRASLDRGIYRIEVSVKFEWIHELQNYFSDKYVMDLTKEAEDLMNTFKLFLVKHEVVACISASSLANSAVSLPDGCWKKVNENGKEGIF